MKNVLIFNEMLSDGGKLNQLPVWHLAAMVTVCTHMTSDQTWTDKKGQVMP